MNNTPETTYFDAVQNYEDAARALRKSLPEPSSTYITQCITRETGFISLTIERLTGNGFGHYDATVLYKEDGAVKYVVVRLELATAEKIPREDRSRAPSSIQCQCGSEEG